MSSDQNHYDHEQDERDYYDKQILKLQKRASCSFRLFALLTLLFLAIMWLVSCESLQMPSSSSIGTVIGVSGDEVTVTFQVVTEEYGSQLANIFYVPGHSYAKGDLYPNPCKHPELMKFCNPETDQL